MSGSYYILESACAVTAEASITVTCLYARAHVLMPTAALPYCSCNHPYVTMGIKAGQMFE